MNNPWKNICEASLPMVLFSWDQPPWYRVSFVKEVSSSNFGMLIAFLLPGFMVLWGVSYFSPTVRLWLSGSGTTPTVGGFMFVTLASVAAGVTVSTVRWLLIDTIHHWTGLPQPRWDFSRLQDNVGAYNVLNDIHYKFYQFHGNGLIALVFIYLARRSHEGIFSAPVGLFDLGFVILSLILFVGSRDTLRKYFGRVGQLLGNVTPEDRSESKQVPNIDPHLMRPDSKSYMANSSANRYPTIKQ